MKNRKVTIIGAGMVGSACAYKLGKVKVYEQPKELIEFGLKSAPQSFVYIKKNKNEKNKS